MVDPNEYKYRRDGRPYPTTVFGWYLQAVEPDEVTLEIGTTRFDPVP